MQSSNKGKEWAEIETVDEKIDLVNNLFIYSGISDNQNGLQDLDLDLGVWPENLKCQLSKSSTSTGYEQCKACHNSSNQTDSAIYLLIVWKVIILIYCGDDCSQIGTND